MKKKQQQKSKRVLILYASVTGNAKYLSKQIYKECLHQNVPAVWNSFNEYDIRNLPNQSFAIFVVSNTGDGEPPPTMVKSWKFLLRKDLASTSLGRTNFTIFGLGDSAYSSFNAMARKLYQRLLQLGANEFHPRGLGDDQHDFGYEGEFDPWSKEMMIGLKNMMKVKDDNDDGNGLQDKKGSFQFPCTIEIQFQKSEELEKQGKQQQANDGVQDKGNSLLSMLKNACLQHLPTPIQSINNQPVYFSKIIKNQRITSNDHFSDVRHLSLKISNNEDESSKSPELNKLTKIKFNPGDICMMHPKNNSETTKKFIQFLGYKPEQIVKIKQIKENLSKSPFDLQLPFDVPISLQHLFEYWVNFQGFPNRQFPQELLRYTKQDSKHHEKLKQFCSKTVEGKSEFYRYCKKQKRTFFQFLWDFNQIKCPLPRLIELIGNLKPREFSISSSPTKLPGQLHLTVGAVKYKTPSQTREKIGLCSQYITQQLKEGQYVPIWIKQGTLKLFQNPSIKYNYIFVGPGTGIAPIKSFIEQIDVRQIDVKQQQPSKVLLFFGNRNKSKDYFYQKEWEELSKKKFFQMECAWSRDQQHKIYVHHKIKESQDKIKNIFQQEVDNKCRTIIYVCGRSKSMPKAVENAFTDIIGKDKIDLMKKTGLYKLQAW